MTEQKRNLEAPEPWGSSQILLTDPSFAYDAVKSSR